MHLSSERLARIEGIAHRLADEDQQRQHDCDGEEPGEPQPGRLQIGLALLQHLAERGGPGRQAEAEEVPNVFAVPLAFDPVKLRAPDNCGPVNLGGEEYVPDDHGYVTVPAEFAATLKSHGFKQV